MRERPTKLQDYNHKYGRGLIRRQSYSQGCQDKEHCEVDLDDNSLVVFGEGVGEVGDEHQSGS